VNFLLFITHNTYVESKQPRFFSKSFELTQVIPLNLWRKLQGFADFNLGKTDNASGAVAIVG
jgi:hypothetical protein